MMSLCKSLKCKITRFCSQKEIAPRIKYLMEIKYAINILVLYMTVEIVMEKYYSMGPPEGAT